MANRPSRPATLAFPLWGRGSAPPPERVPPLPKIDGGGRGPRRNPVSPAKHERSGRFSPKAPRFVEVLITAGSAPEARRIARRLVERRLAACVNLYPIRSIYRWKGSVEEAREVALAVKTTRENYRALEAEVRRLHSYEVPCVIALPVEEGHKPYLQWVAESTRPPRSSRARQRRER